MIHELQSALATGIPGYDELPDTIRHNYTPMQFSWMTDAQRANVITDNCNPEIFEDGV